MAMRISPTPTTLPERSMWTFADVQALPDDGNRYEILHGELLVTPLPSSGHQGIAMALSARLWQWCGEHTGWEVHAPGGMYVSETNWLEPDVCVYPVPRHTDGRWQDMPTPLVVEILSRSTTKRDRHRKRPAYLSSGVGEVWLVDRRMRTIERWTAASEFPEVFQGSISWTPDVLLPPFLVTEMELFGPKAT